MTTRIMGWLACAGAVVLLIVALITGTAPASAAAAAARITDATVRLAVVPGRPAAGYFTLTATAPVELIRVTSPLARVELHGMSTAGGVMRMDPLPAVRVAAGQRVSFTPGGAHLMLFDVPASVRPGGTLPLTFVFAGGAAVTVAANVAAATDAAMTMPMGHGAH